MFSGKTWGGMEGKEAKGGTGDRVEKVEYRGCIFNKLHTFKCSATYFYPCLRPSCLCHTQLMPLPFILLVDTLLPSQSVLIPAGFQI